MAVSTADIGARRALLALLQLARGGVMWRTTKSSIEHELSIPKQVTSVVRLDLNAIQKHALRRAVRAVRKDLLPALPGVVAAAVLDGCAAPPMQDRAVTAREQAIVMKALDTTRKVLVDCCTLMTRPAMWLPDILTALTGCLTLSDRVSLWCQPPDPPARAQAVLPPPDRHRHRSRGP
jgi:hypothetical protein